MLLQGREDIPFTEYDFGTICDRTTRGRRKASDRLFSGAQDHGTFNNIPCAYIRYKKLRNQFGIIARKKIFIMIISRLLGK